MLDPEISISFSMREEDGEFLASDSIIEVIK